MGKSCGLRLGIGLQLQAVERKIEQCIKYNSTTIYKSVFKIL